MTDNLFKLMAEPEPVEMHWQETAVVIVDMQNAFVSNGGMFDLRGIDISRCKEIVPRISRIIEMSRHRNVPVYYICHVLSEDLREVSPSSSFWYKSVRFYRENPQYADRFLIRGTWGADIIDDLSPLKTDIVVEKPRFSAFYGTNFDLQLRSKNIKNLLFTGCATNICVEASIRDAANLNYFPILISDACANNGPAFMQDATIFNVKLCLGWVATTANFLSAPQN